MSWITVPIVIWQIIVTLFSTSRELLTETPNEIKALRYPLSNNPQMSPEAVWAHLCALLLKVGDAPQHEYEIIDSLNEASEIVPSFNQIKALNHLNNLNAYSAEVISSAIDLIKEGD